MNQDDPAYSDFGERRRKLVVARVAIGEALAGSNASPPQATASSNDGVSEPMRFTKRYKTVADEKAGGATYTPPILADFVARQIVKLTDSDDNNLRILDPAIGDGELLVSILRELNRTDGVDVHGFETDPAALGRAQARIKEEFPNVSVHFRHGDFLEFAKHQFEGLAEPSLFSARAPEAFDLIIANPPYVRTQIMGAQQAQMLARLFGLRGRVDLYYAFLKAIAHVLKPHGIAGIIVSNRFMTTKSGAAVRVGIQDSFDVRQVWDLGDTKIFDAAVLPAVLLVKGKNGQSAVTPLFSSIYETDAAPNHEAADPIDALEYEGVAALPDGRRFQIRHGKLEMSGDSVWRIETKASSDWLAAVTAHTWGTFRDIGRIRVGVKTCADKIFIRHDWDNAFGVEKPELLRSLTTHHGAGRFRGTTPKKTRAILYPHEVHQGNRQPIPLERYPKSRSYLEAHRVALESRSYVIEAGRRWYEIWVPQDPSAWSAPKLVFRDISERPMFWIDLDGSVVNGDCYWLVAGRTEDIDLLWLAAAVANSSFAEAFYDHRFNNKLYAGRRRFITQYVEKFPLPDPALPLSQDITARAKAIFDANHAPETQDMERELDERVWKAFGLDIEEVRR